MYTSCRLMSMKYTLLSDAFGGGREYSPFSKVHRNFLKAVQ